MVRSGIDRTKPQLSRPEKFPACKRIVSPGRAFSTALLMPVSGEVRSKVAIPICGFPRQARTNTQNHRANLLILTRKTNYKDKKLQGSQYGKSAGIPGVFLTPCENGWTLSTGSAESGIVLCLWIACRDQKIKCTAWKPLQHPKWAKFFVWTSKLMSVEAIVSELLAINMNHEFYSSNFDAFEEISL